MDFSFSQLKKRGDGDYTAHVYYAHVNPLNHGHVANANDWRLLFFIARWQWGFLLPIGGEAAQH